MIKRILALLLLFSSILSLASCGGDEPTVKRKYYYEYCFDTFGTLYDYTGSSDEDFNALSDSVERELAEYHKLFDIYNEYDGIVNLATLNRLAGEGPQAVDSRIVDMLLFAKEMYTLTGGECNVAMGAVLSIWHDYRSEGVALPSEAELRAAAEHIDIDDLVIDKAAGTVELRDPEMSLDVGAVGKGYAVEMIARRMESEGLSGYILDVGGNLRAIGEKLDGSGWRAGVKNPANPYSTSYVYYLTLKDAALVTSGNYERYYTVGGVNYHHIIDKDTLMPENYYTSVSIMTESSALCDALSTALFNMPPEDARALVESIDGAFAVFVYADGTVEPVGAQP